MPTHTIVLASWDSPAINHHRPDADNMHYAAAGVVGLIISYRTFDASAWRRLPGGYRVLNLIVPFRRRTSEVNAARLKARGFRIPDGGL